MNTALVTGWRNTQWQEIRLKMRTRVALGLSVSFQSTFLLLWNRKYSSKKVEKSGSGYNFVAAEGNDTLN
jgi:hypothetical protein